MWRVLTILAAVAGCTSGDSGDGASPTGDTGTTDDTGRTTLPDTDRVLVMSNADGLWLVDTDGNDAWTATWAEMLGSCSGCGGEGASADGDGLLVSYTIGGSMNQSGIARIGSDGSADWSLPGFSFAHDAVRDPLDDTVIVPEASANQIRWVAGDGSSATAVRTIAGVAITQPNGIERVDLADATLLLSSHRGGAAGGGGQGEGASGRIDLWDISSDQARELWTYPESGSLHTPHGAVFRQHGGRWWLLYAHSYGVDGSHGSVGLAVTDDPTVRPTYVADLVPDTLDAFVFLRGVELDTDGTLYLTDSGSMNGGSNGRLVSAAFPTLSPTGASGAYEDQVFVDLEDEVLLRSGMPNPFEGFLWTPTF
ncbi:MAG: hypothetical protein H6735_30855 [Alphaproteobacteria bacterium]|nr:hypothetical protein [Alphaproteobacteria bacterium]